MRKIFKTVTEFRLRKDKGKNMSTSRRRSTKKLSFKHSQWAFCNLLTFCFLYKMWECVFSRFVCFFFVCSFFLSSHCCFCRFDHKIESSKRNFLYANANIFYSFVLCTFLTSSICIYIFMGEQQMQLHISPYWHFRQRKKKKTEKRHIVDPYFQWQCCASLLFFSSPCCLACLFSSTHIYILQLQSLEYTSIYTHFFSLERLSEQCTSLLLRWFLLSLLLLFCGNEGLTNPKNILHFWYTTSFFMI